MRRWDEVSIQTLRTMRADGKSAQEISTSIGRSKSAVNTRLYLDGLTKDGQRRSLKANSESVARETRIRETIELMSQRGGYAMGYVLGTLCGDGFISHQKRGGVVLGLGVRSQKFSEKFAKCLGEVAPENVRVRTFDYKYKPKDSIIRTPGREVLRRGSTYIAWNVTCCSPGVARFFETMKAEFLAGKSLSGEVKHGVLDGLFDSEGYFVRTAGTAGLGMTNLPLLRWVSDELLRLGIHNKVYTDKNGYYSYVSIHRKGAVRKFCAVVRFSVEHRERTRLKLLED